MKFSSLIYYAKPFFSRRSITAFINSCKWFVEDRLIPYQKLNKHGDSFVHPSVIFKEPQNIFLGKKTRVQPNVCMWASPNAKIVLGDFSGIGPGTMLFASNHKYEFGKIYIQQPWVEKDIIIGENVWIGSGCIITAGVTIGGGSVVGAGSVVNKDIPPNSLAVGVPAKVIKDGSDLSKS